MAGQPKPHDDHSPLAILTELAVEGTSSLVEAQRTLLTLAQQENDIILNGVKDRVGSFVPAVAMTDLVRRSLDTLIGMQQELLTTTSKQTPAVAGVRKDGEEAIANTAGRFCPRGSGDFCPHTEEVP